MAKRKICNDLVGEMCVLTEVNKKSPNTNEWSVEMFDLESELTPEEICDELIQDKFEVVAIALVEVKNPLKQRAIVEFSSYEEGEQCVEFYNKSNIVSFKPLKTRNILKKFTCEINEVSDNHDEGFSKTPEKGPEPPKLKPVKIVKDRKLNLKNNNGGNPLQPHVDNLETENDELRKENTELKITVEKKDSQIEEVKKLYKQAEHELEKRNKELEKSDEDCIRYKEQHAELVEYNKAENDRHRNFATEKGAELKKVNKILLEKDNELTKEKEKNKKLNDIIKSLNEKIKEYEAGRVAFVECIKKNPILTSENPLCKQN